MAELFSNLAESTVASITRSGNFATTDPIYFNVATGEGAKFPAAAQGSTDYFHAVIDSGTSVEILRCQRNGDEIQADRAQEGTAKVNHSLGVKFAHVLTASAIQQIPAYVQSSTATTKGDLFARTATGIVRLPVGSQDTVLTADPTGSSTQGLKWTIPTSGGGGGAAWQEPDYTIYYSGSQFFLRNEKTTSATAYTTSLHAPFNAAATALGTGTTFTGTGGLIVLSNPSGKVMPTTAPLVMQNQVTLRGVGRACVIQATGGGWGGTLLVPTAVIDAYLKSRVKVEGVSIDCAGIAGTTGIIFEKGTGSTGGNDAHSYFLFNEVRGFTISGIQIGRKNSAGATSTAWLFGNQVVDDVGSNAVGVGFYVGDAHYGWGNNIKMSSSNGYPMYIGANSVHVLNGGHMVNNANCPHALITVVGGNPCRIEGVYFDNLRNFGAVDVNTEGSGTSNRMTITNNWCHLTSTTNYPGTASVFRLNAVNGGLSGITIANNIGEADTETVRFTSIVDITNPASGARIQNTLAMYGNQFQHVNAFITANNGGTTPAVGTNMNIIESSNTGGGSNGTVWSVGP
jgi:hypothetical protein